ncbi:uncharacterized protein STEHIDRAFT_146804 [Stereum hirsutum FP-91666 SS1]|uniref:uncharacterized protein n=1 Tax=Stereum hirsutum (strain FP-91666) TaxID=721885 RepID=UPI000440AB00|nr:uncharacterized protein STEHIDRAFT_146804 [Stereum hirsutum FP-91666 SS1]EIM87426.1 hypothetical protein STEHIDRAFT_146804 [Stereum hirsutum FP-91666 SS1]
MPRQVKKKGRSASFTWDYRSLNNTESNHESTDDTESDSGTSLLDEKEWTSLHHVVRCDEYEAGEDVLVWGQGMNPNIDYDIHKYWVGRIIEFATKVEEDDKDEKKDWARVQWYYSRRDIAHVNPLLDAKGADPWERLLSDHFDSIPVSTIKEPVIVRRYDESALIPWEKHEGQFYCCYNYDFNKFKVTPQAKKQLSFDETPSPAEWQMLDRFDSIVEETREEGSRSEYRAGQDILVMNSAGEKVDYPLHQCFVAKIVEFGLRKIEGKEMWWVRVQWYYSKAELSQQLRGFEHRTWGRYERILTTHFDHIAFARVIGHTVVKRYSETSLYQEQINDGEFYCRRLRYDPERNEFSPPNLPLCHGTFGCNQPYSPDHDTVMHFCPRPNCQRWYHQPCLLYDRHFDTRMGRAERDGRMLSSVPDDDEGPFALRSALTIRISTRSHPTATTPQIWAYQEPNLQGASGIMLEELPRELVKVAQSPIIKGVGIGIAGNIKEVIEARRLVLDCLELKDGHDVKARCYKWMERRLGYRKIEKEEAKDAVGEGVREG